MKKKLLIIVSALMMLFGSALTVSAEESDTEETAIVKPLEYVELYYEDKKLWLDDDGTLLKGGYRIEVSIDKQLDTPVYACFIKLDSKGSEERPWYELYVYDYDKQSFESGSISIGEDSSSIIQYNIDKDGNETVASENVFSILNALWLYAEVVDFDGWRQFDTLDTLVTNIPMFDTEESAKNYFVNGDRSGIINDSYDNMVSDDSFGLKGFQADNTITATWTGTTHDDVIDTYNKAKVGIRPGYAYKSAPGQIAVRSTVLQEYDIADKTFTKLYEELKPSDDTLFLRYLEVIPNYQKTALSTMYVGKSCWIWFNADGTVEKVVNDFERSGGGSSDSEYNSDFYLIKVKGFADSISEWLKDPIYYIEWKGTSLDEELLADYVEPDDTSVSVYCIGVSDSGVKKQYDYLALDPFIDELTIWSKFGMVTNTFNQFEINLDVIEATMLQDGLTFEGEFYLVPQYKKDSRQYIRGCTTSVNIFTGEVNNIVEEPGEDDVIVPVTPPDDDDDDDDDPDDSGLPDIGGIGDIPTFMINLIKSFFGFVGYVPNLLGVIFPFLPTEINYLLSLGLVVSVVLRIVGR